MTRTEATIEQEAPPEPARRYLTRGDVARLMGVSPNTVTRWARQRKLPCQITLGGHHRFDPEVIERIRRRLSRAVEERE